MESLLTHKAVLLLLAALSIIGHAASVSSSPKYY
jgi:hypothetical protein